MKIQNLDKLQKKLRAIPDAVRVRAKADLVAGAREINMLQRSLAPKDDMVLAGSIRNDPLPDPEVGVVLLAGGEATTKPIRDNKSGGGSPEYDYALAQEFGTSKMQANAFFYPGYHARKKRVMRQVRAGWKRTLKAQGGK
ncbi:hypothetical protein GHV40_14285 [Devosia sp. D6-9]|nr:hypothetical protein GHV40_14285 [Devosia sp. D6-9]